MNSSVGGEGWSVWFGESITLGGGRVGMSIC